MLITNCVERTNKTFFESHYEKGIISLYQESGLDNGFEVHKVGKAVILISPDYYEYSNLILKEVTPEVFSFMKENFPRHRFYVLIDSHRIDLQKIALDNGFYEIATETEMFFDVSQYKQQPIDQSVKVIEVDSDKIMYEWCEVKNSVYADEDPCDPFEIPLQAPCIIRYLAYYNDKPAATARLYINGEYVYLYSVTVKGEFRRRGVCLALLQACLQSPYVKSAKYVIGSASNMGQPLYEKM